ncbi:UNVERIFIED_CONTAM: hypothetical protein RMT77_016389 [Armadillidium vulgare]
MPKGKKGSDKNLKSEIKNTVVYSPYFDNRKVELGSTVRQLCFGRNSLTSKFLPDFSHVNRKNENFYNQECLKLAKALLGQLVVRLIEGKRLSGFIIETECYLGSDDVASHSHNGKRTPRNEPMFMPAGTSYVYSIYGMYHCFNISSKEDGSCVLIRALEPYENQDKMTSNRLKGFKSTAKQLKVKELCNGPSKLCRSLNITKESCNKVNMINSDIFWLENGVDVPEEEIVVSKRVGIESAGEEWANKLLRFYIIDNTCVSVRDKVKEELKKL